MKINTTLPAYGAYQHMEHTSIWSVPTYGAYQHMEHASIWSIPAYGAYLEKRARARASLILQPPENSLVGLLCISGEKPKPAKMILALAGALSDSICCSWAYTSVSCVLSSGSAFLSIRNHFNIYITHTHKCLVALTQKY
jgi:hypothetical protein